MKGLGTLLRFGSKRCSRFGYKAILLAAGILICIQAMLQITELYYTKYFHNIHEWPSRTTTFCGGNITGYARKFFRMKSAIYDPGTDSFQLECKKETLPPSYIFVGNSYGVGKYIKRIGHVTDTSSIKVTRLDGLTIIVDRANAHNYYHAMQDWYNMFLISKFFNLDYRNTRLILIDRSPDFQTDFHWMTMFPRLTKVKDLKSLVLLDEAIFSLAGPNNPMEYWELDTLPYMEEFSQTFLSVFNLNKNKHLNCKNLTITLIIRRDYYVRPTADFLLGKKRNAQRKFKNENELVKTLEETFTGHTIRTMIAEDLSLKKQLELIAQTDILMGMHGCAFTNTWFMPRHGAIFEMYPKYWDVQNFFSAIARWRGIKYRNWRNENKEYEFPNYYTYVPPEVLVRNVNTFYDQFGCAQ